MGPMLQEVPRGGAAGQLILAKAMLRQYGSAVSSRLRHDLHAGTADRRTSCNLCLAELVAPGDPQQPSILHRCVFQSGEPSSTEMTGWQRCIGRARWASTVCHRYYDLHRVQQLDREGAGIHTISCSSCDIVQQSCPVCARELQALMLQRVLPGQNGHRCLQCTMDRVGAHEVTIHPVNDALPMLRAFRLEANGSL